MIIPKYWARAGVEERTPAGRRLAVTCWQWSESSVAEAHARAREVAERIARRIRNGEPFPARYAYGARPLREETLRELRGRDGALAAVVTRNAYGSLVLNAARALFVDVDLAAPRVPLLRRLGTWLRSRDARATAPADGESAAALARLRSFLDARVGWGVRVYRTRAGLRYLMTHAGFDPASDEAASVMTALGCDPRYMQLCRSQKSFRARLTPKPWRCGAPRPPGRWPWEGAEVEARARAWQARYDATCARFATCSSPDLLGNQWVHGDIEPIVRLHDELTRAGSGLPLA